MVANQEKHKLRVVFIGTSSAYSAYPLHGVAEHHTLVGIIESAPRGATVNRLTDIQKTLQYWFALSGRPSLWVLSKKWEVPYLYLSKGNLHRLADFLQQVKADIGCVASMNHLLPEEIIHIPPHGFINMHPSLLPKYRGPSAWFWHYYDMEKEGGVTVHYIDPGEDTGDIIQQESFPIPLGMNPYDMMHTAIKIGSTLLVKTLNEIAAGNITAITQRHFPSPRRARRLNPREDLFHWQEWSIEKTYHFLGGVYPWYNVFQRIRGPLKRIPWKAISYEKASIKPPYGGLRFGMQGIYFAHPEGKIRLQPRLSLFRLMLIGLLILALINLIISYINL